MANFEYGMLSQGFVPKRLVDINNDMLEELRPFKTRRQVSSLSPMRLVIQFLLNL